MKKIQGFLDKFHKLTPPNDAVRRAIAVAASAVLGVPVEKGQIKVTNGTAFVAVSSVAKHKLRLERRAVLELLYEKMPKARDSVRGIR